MRLAWGLEKYASDYISARFPDLTRNNPYRPHKAVAIISDDNTMVGAIGLCLINEFEGSISIAIDDWKFFPNKTALKELFERVFGDEEKGLFRLSCQIARGNRKARRIVEHLGFKVEGMKRLGYDRKQHAMLYGMLRSECPWLGEGHGPA